MRTIITNDNLSQELAKVEGQLKSLKVTKVYAEYDKAHMSLNPYDEQWEEKYDAIKKMERKARATMRNYLKSEEWYCAVDATTYEMYCAVSDCASVKYDITLSKGI